MAFKTGNQQLPGYSQPWGSKISVVFDRTGPASYAIFSTPTTGGDVLNASDIGVGGFDAVDLGVDTTGQIQAMAVLSLGGYGNAVPSVIIIYYSLVTASLGGQSQVIGTQILNTTNLSTFSWRATAICV